MEIFLIVWICMAILCARIAQKKGRDPIIWGVIGCLTSIVGLIIVAMCEDKSSKE